MRLATSAAQAIKINGSLQTNRAASRNHGPSRVKCRSGSTFANGSQGRGVNSDFMPSVYGANLQRAVGKPVEIALRLRGNPLRTGHLGLVRDFVENAGFFRYSPAISLPVPRYLGKVAPNPSIERTHPGKPGRASHVKR